MVEKIIINGKVRALGNIVESHDRYEYLLNKCTVSSSNGTVDGKSLRVFTLSRFDDYFDSMNNIDGKGPYTVISGTCTSGTEFTNITSVLDSDGAYKFNVRPYWVDIPVPFQLDVTLLNSTNNLSRCYFYNSNNLNSPIASGSLYTVNSEPTLVRFTVTKEGITRKIGDNTVSLSLTGPVGNSVRFRYGYQQTTESAGISLKNLRITLLGDDGGESHDYSLSFSESSYTAIGGNVVLECILLDGGVVVPNATVTLSDGTSQYSSITNSSGVASFSLTGLSSSGTYTCSYGNVSDTCTVTVTNYLFAPKLDGTDSISDWGGSGHTYTVTDGVIQARNVTFNDSWDNTIDWELTCEMKANVNSGFEIVEASQTSADKYCLQCLEDGHLFWNYIPGTSRTYQKISTSTSTSDYQTIKIRKENGTYSWYINDTLQATTSVTDSWSSVKMAFHSWTDGRYCYLKNIEVVPI